MAKLYSNSVVVVSTRCEEGVSYNVPSDEEFSIRALGRGRWDVESEDGSHTVMRTAGVQRFIRRLSRRYIGDYWSSGEPQYFVREVYITRA